MSSEMKLSITMNNETVTLVVPEEKYCTLDKFLGLIPRLCVGAGWIPGSFPDCMGEITDWVATLEEK